MMRALKGLSKAARLLMAYPVLSLFPMSLAYSLAALISPMDRNFRQSYMRQWVKGLEKCILQGKGLKIEDRNKCIKKHLHMLSLEALDSYLVPRLNPSQMKKLSHIEGVHHIEKALSRGKGLIIATSHFCRLNMTAYSLGHMGVRNGILSQAVDKDNPYLDWIDRRFLTKKLKKYYEVTKGPGLTLKDNPRHIYRALKRNEIMVILMDAYPETVRNFYHVPFLGGTLKLPRGIARISQKTESPIVYSVVKPRKKWQVKVEIRPTAGIGEDAFFQTVKEFRQDILDMPCQWWQWAYMNTMWKSKITDEQ